MQLYFILEGCICIGFKPKAMQRMTHTSLFSFNKHQADSFNRITMSVANEDSPLNLHILKGSAGTGKTFVTRQIVKYLMEKGVNVVQVAPTGKAAKNMAMGSTLPARTIHSAIFQLEQLSQGFGVKFLRKPNLDSKYTVYVVDESSMISDKVTRSEGFQQSGALLSELIDYARRGNNQNKFLFIGDPCQLPPVEPGEAEGNSPALMLNYLSQQFDLKGQEYFLSEPMRTKGDSYILDNATYLRDCIIKGITPNRQRFTVNSTGRSRDTARYFQNLYDPEHAEKVILIANANRDVNYWNRAIRKQFGYEQDQLSIGDQVVVNVNWHGNGQAISNGETGYVRAVGKAETFAGLKFADVQLEFQGADGKPFLVETKTLLDTLNTEPTFNGSIDSETGRHFHAEMHKKTAGKMESSPFYNPILLRFGYALTCHKAQGSEWDNVIVHPDPLFGGFQKTSLRWRYTAMTRARRELYTWAA